MISYVYFCHIILSDRQVFALFSTSSSQAYFFVLNRVRDEAIPNINKIYQESFERRIQENDGMPWQDLLDYPEDMQFKVSTMTSRRKVHVEISDALKRMRQEEKDKALVLVVQSQQVNMLAHEIPVMKELPILSLKPDES